MFHCSILCSISSYQFSIINNLSIYVSFCWSNQVSISKFNQWKHQVHHKTASRLDLERFSRPLTDLSQFFSPKLHLENFWILKFNLGNFHQLPKNLDKLVGNNPQPISLSSYFYSFSTELKLLNRADCNTIMFPTLDQAECANEPDSNTIPYT